VPNPGELKAARNARDGQAFFEKSFFATARHSYPLGGQSMRRIILLCCLLTLGMTASTSAQKPTTIATFNGVTPFSLIVSNGAVYGLTDGGANGLGTVFQVKRVNDSWQVNSLHDFVGGTDGSGPDSLIIDSSGTALYGITYGDFGIGTLFGLTQNPNNGVWTYNGSLETSLIAPPFPTTVAPFSLVAVPSVPGAFYFLTEQAGPGVFGRIIEVAPPSSPVTAYSFIHPGNDCLGRPDGFFPATLISSSGVIYGMTGSDGTFNAGTVFSFIGGCEQVIYNFNSNEGGSLVGDNLGALYLIAPSSKTISKLTPNGGSWSINAIKTFGRNIGDELSPRSLVVDSSGTLYGTAEGGVLTALGQYSG
jgi:hypothetical protein